MQTTQIVKEISRLPLGDKIFVAEQILKQLREDSSSKIKEAENRRKAAEVLLKDYQSDKNLTAFSAIEHEDFYEAK